jgi:MFS family permease
LITFASAAGAMSMKMAAAAMLKRFGFRSIMVLNALVSSLFLAACALFTDATPVALMFGVLLIGGFFRSLQFTSINTLAYAEVEQSRVSRATALLSVGQQLSISTGVALGALAVDLAAEFHGHTDLRAADFQTAFVVVAAISALSFFVFVRLSADDGAELSGRAPVDPKPTAEL